MTDKERLEEIINSSKLSANAFSKEIGLKGPQSLYDIMNEKHGISKKMAQRIHAKYLNYNFTWIWTGEGSKYKNSNYQNKPFSTDDNSVNNEKEVYGQNIQINQLTNIIESQQRTIENNSDVIKTLSKTIEDLTKKKNGSNGNGKSASSA